jgi:hypothetical protein
MEINEILKLGEIYMLGKQNNLQNKIIIFYNLPAAFMERW